MKTELTKDEQELLTHIQSHMKKYHTTSWFQIYGSKYEPIVKGLVKKGVLVWDLKKHEYVLGKEKEK
jgi:hypothetical protein